MPEKRCREGIDKGRELWYKWVVRLAVPLLTEGSYLTYHVECVDIRKARDTGRVVPVQRCEGRYVCTGCLHPQGLSIYLPFRLGLHMREHVWKGQAGIGGLQWLGRDHVIAFDCFIHGLEELVSEEVGSFKLPEWGVWRRGQLTATDAKCDGAPEAARQ